MDELVGQLRKVLASAIILYLKTHSAHWNVEGPLFPELHALFERLYQDIWESVDSIAEKLRQLDVHVDVSLEEIRDQTQIRPFFGPLTASAMVAELFTDNETMIGVLNEAIEDATEANEQGIVSFLATRVEEHQKWRWFLRVTRKQV